MFTGLVSDVGQIESLEAGNSIRRLVIASSYDPDTIPLGASIACNGVCLTVVAVEAAGGRDGKGGSRFSVDAAPETLAVTTVEGWRRGDRINLERALRMGDELGGHLVAGHVDGVAAILERTDIGEATRFEFEAPQNLARFIAPKGSVCLDGTSLTVNTVEGSRFSCLLIPHTLDVTLWGARQAGESVNIEVDLMARYAARLAEAGALG
jgi:riboflavin synthase